MLVILKTLLAHINFSAFGGIFIASGDFLVVKLQ